MKSNERKEMATIILKFILIAIYIIPCAILTINYMFNVLIGTIMCVENVKKSVLVAVNYMGAAWTLINGVAWCNNFFPYKNMPINNIISYMSEANKLLNHIVVIVFFYRMARYVIEFYKYDLDIHVVNLRKEIRNIFINIVLIESMYYLWSKIGFTLYSILCNTYDYFLSYNIETFSGMIGALLGLITMYVGTLFPIPTIICNKIEKIQKRKWNKND